MTKCSNCQTYQDRLKRGLLCDSCYTKGNKDVRKNNSSELSHLGAANMENLCGSNMTINDDYWSKLNSILDTKIQRIETKFDTAIGGLNSQVKTLQTKCVQYEEEIETLKSIVVKQQQTLSRLDMDERNSSVIVSGLSENDIVHGEHTYKSDLEKISALLGEIGLSLPV